MGTASNKNRPKHRSGFLRLNRELMVFLVFLFVAVAFWFIQTFKDSTSMSLTYKLQVEGIPNSVIVTSKIPDDVTFRIHGRGFDLLRLLFSSQEEVVVVDYKNLKDTGKSLIIDSEVWKRSIDKILPPGISVNERGLQQTEIYYSNGEHKSVPVVFTGKVSTEDEYIVCDIRLTPSHVDIYAPVESFDTITGIPTSKLSLENLHDTTNVSLQLAPPVGVKCVPEQINAQICVDMQSTRQISVPIYTINSPQNIVLKPFPMNASVTFTANAGSFNKIKEDEFNCVIDYNTIKPTDTQCKVNLTSVPEGVSNVKYSPQYVEFVIEQLSDVNE